MRPVKSLVNVENLTVNVYEAVVDGIATDDERTTGNRIVRYRCRCKLCQQISYVRKQTLLLGRVCPVCAGLWAPFRVSSLADRRLNKTTLSGTYTAFLIDGQTWIARGSPSDLIEGMAPSVRAAWENSGTKQVSAHLAPGEDWLVFGEPVAAQTRTFNATTAPSPELVRELEEARGCGTGLEPACPSAHAPDQDSDWVFMKLDEWLDIQKLFAADSRQETDNLVLAKYPDYYMRRSWVRTSLGHQNPNYVYVYESIETFDIPF